MDKNFNKAKKSDDSNGKGQKPAETDRDAKKSDDSKDKGQKPVEADKDAKKSDDSKDKGEMTTEADKEPKKPDDAKDKSAVSFDEKSNNRIVSIKKDYSKGNFRIIILANSPIEAYKPSLSNGIDPKFYIVFNGKWEDLKTQYKPEDGDIVKAIKIDNQPPDKIKLVFDLTENIQFPSIEKSSEGLIITIKKLE